MARQASAIHQRPVKYADGDHRQEGRISSLDDTWADNTTPHQQREVIRQLDRGEESLTEIGRSHNDSSNKCRCTPD